MRDTECSPAEGDQRQRRIGQCDDSEDQGKGPAGIEIGPDSGHL